MKPRLLEPSMLAVCLYLVAAAILVTKSSAARSLDDVTFASPGSKSLTKRGGCFGKVGACFKGGKSRRTPQPDQSEQQQHSRQPQQSGQPPGVDLKDRRYKKGKKDRKDKKGGEDWKEMTEKNLAAFDKNNSQMYVEYAQGVRKFWDNYVEKHQGNLSADQRPGARSDHKMPEGTSSWAMLSADQRKLHVKNERLKQKVTEQRRKLRQDFSKQNPQQEEERRQLKHLSPDKYVAMSKSNGERADEHAEDPVQQGGAQSPRWSESSSESQESTQSSNPSVKSAQLSRQSIKSAQPSKRPVDSAQPRVKEVNEIPELPDKYVPRREMTEFWNSLKLTQ